MNYNYLLDKLSEKSNNIIKPAEFVDEYKNYKSNEFFTLICTLCNNKFNKRIKDIITKGRNVNCMVCHTEKMKNKNRLSDDEINLQLKPYEFIYISGYKNKHSVINVQCKNNHIFEQQLNNIIYNSGNCPLCVNNNKLITENICKQIFELIFNDTFNKTRSLPWLINKDGNYIELDGYNDKLKIAFEYNGIQHYKYITFFHKTINDFNKLQTHDKLKTKLCKNNNIKLIIIPYTVKNLLEYIYNQLDINKIKYTKKDIKIENYVFRYQDDKNSQIDHFIKDSKWERITNYMYAREHITLQCKDCNFNYKISYDNLFRLKSKIIKCTSCLINVIENKCKDLGYKMMKYKSEDFLEIECLICNNIKIYKGLNSNHILSQDVVKICCN